MVDGLRRARRGHDGQRGRRRPRPRDELRSVTSATPPKVSIDRRATAHPLVMARSLRKIRPRLSPWTSCRNDGHGGRFGHREAREGEQVGTGAGHGVADGAAVADARVGAPPLALCVGVPERVRQPCHRRPSLSSSSALLDVSSSRSCNSGQLVQLRMGAAVGGELDRRGLQPPRSGSSSASGRGVAVGRTPASGHPARGHEHRGGEAVLGRAAAALGCGSRRTRRRTSAPRPARATRCLRRRGRWPARRAVTVRKPSSCRCAELGRKGVRTNGQAAAGLRAGRDLVVHQDRHPQRGLGWPSSLWRVDRVATGGVQPSVSRPALLLSPQRARDVPRHGGAQAGGDRSRRSSPDASPVHGVGDPVHDAQGQRPRGVSPLGRQARRGCRRWR